MWIVECCQDYRLSAKYSHEVWRTKYLLIFKVKSKKHFCMWVFSFFISFWEESVTQINRKVVHKSLAIGFNHFKFFILFGAVSHILKLNQVLLLFSKVCTLQVEIKSNTFYTIHNKYSVFSDLWKNLNLLPLFIDLYLKWHFTVQTK